MADIKIKNVEANQKKPLKAKIQLKKDKKEIFVENMPDIRISGIGCFT